MSTTLTKINIYSDGACSGNQHNINIGGWGTVLEMGVQTKELFGGEVNTTNNKMELTALLEGLRALKRYNLDISIYSDSAYVINGLSQKWYEKWEKNGWKTSQKKAVENKELWQEIITIIRKIHQVSYFHVKGHLDLNKTSEVNKWRTKFENKYGRLTDKQFQHIIERNHLVDKLANKGMEQYK